MNVLKTLMNVIIMLLATTFQGVTNAIATLDTEGMGFVAQVSVVLITDALYSDVEMSQNSGGCHRNCHTLDGSYLCPVAIN